MFSMLHAEKGEGLVDFADVMDVVWDDAGSTRNGMRIIAPSPTRSVRCRPADRPGEGRARG